MTTINDLIIRTARDLNDYTDHIPNKQFQRWTIEQLLGYWNEAMCVIFTLNPSKFKHSRVAKLKPGINQVIDDCSRVLSVLGVSDKDGNVLYEIDQDRDDFKLPWKPYRKAMCKQFMHSRDFRLLRYRIESDKDGSIFVKPAVPYGVDVYLKYICECKPTPFSINDLEADIEESNCTVASFGIHWVLFRALMVDEESQSSTSLATNHLQLFFKLIEAKHELDKDANLNIDMLPKSLQQFVVREIAKYKIGVR